MELMIAYVALYSVFAITTATGLFLLRASDQKSRTFALATIAAGLWALLNGIYQQLPGTSSGLTIVANLSYIAAALIATGLVQFSKQFDSKRVKIPMLPSSVVWTGFLVTSVLCLVPGLVVSSIGIDKSIQTTPAIFGFVGYFGIGVLYFFSRIVAALLSSSGVLKQQIVLILIGSAISTLFGLLLNLVLPLTGNYAFVWSGPLFLTVFILFTGYAIVTTKLFDIQLVIKRAAAFSALVGFVVLIYAVAGFTLAGLFGFTPDSNATLFVNILLTLIVSVSIRPLRRWLSVKTDAIFFKQDYNEREVVRDLGIKLNSVIGLDEALEIVMQTLIGVLHLRHSVAYVFPQEGHESDQPVRILPVGYSQTQHLPLGEADGVRAYFTVNPLLVSASEIMNSGGSRSEAILSTVQAKLQSIEAEMIVPLYVDSQLIGLLALSEKQSGDKFSKQDLSLFKSISDQAISSIQKARLYESDQAKNEFVSVASHELITPISAIEGYIDYVLQPQEGKTPLEPRTKEYLDNVKSAVHRLSSQLKDLLDVSRIESGKMAIDYRSVDVGFVVRDTVNQLRFIAQEKKISVEIEVPADIPEIWADSDRTVQVIVNLLSNAIKYNRPEGSVLITGKLRKSDGMVEISVSDTGFGMKAEQMTHLFEKFYRIDSSKTVGIVGTGLGLYITKSIIERMGGTISVKSTENKGTTFTVALPSTKRIQATGLIASVA
jgi:signal transduction histidine kinase/preprotein translocase subunit Sec61beta